MAELFKPFPNPADLNEMSPAHYPFVADIESSTARVALVGVGGHRRDSGHEQYRILDTIFDRFNTQSSTEGTSVTCYFEGGPRPPGETSPDIPAEDAIARHAESGWLIRRAREKHLAAESWDLLMGDGIDALMSLYRGEPVAWAGDYQLPEYVHKLWPTEPEFGSWLGFHHLMKLRAQWLAIKEETDPGDFLPYALDCLEAHGAVKASRENGIGITNMAVLENIHKAACTDAGVNEKLVPLNPEEAPEETGPAAYLALHTAPFSRSPRNIDDLTRLRHIGEMSDSVLRNLHFANLVDRLLAETTSALMLSGGWHAYHVADYLSKRGRQVERMTWHVGMSACQEALERRPRLV